MAKQFLDLQGLQYFWGKIKERLNTKVDKVEGYALSKNDFTDDYKTLLDGLGELDGIAVEDQITADGNNPVKSSAIYAALDLKVNNVDFEAYKQAQVTALAGKVDVATFEAHEQAQVTALAGKVDNSAFEAFQGTNSEAINKKLDASAFETFKGTNSEAIAKKLDIATFTAHEEAQATALAGKVAVGDFESFQEANTEALNAKVDDSEFATFKEANTQALNAKVDTAVVGAANGVAQLDANGMVPAAQLPSYVDDVVEGIYGETFPETGETGKIYVDTKTNKTYRWSGSQYSVISDTIALGETAATAFAGDKGKIAYEFAVAGDAKTVNGLTVETAVPANAVFTDTTYESITNGEIDTLMAD